MWLPDKILAQVDQLARIYYLGREHTKRWNEHRDSNELRMLSGWCWVAKDGSAHGQGLKTMTVAYREAYYALVAKASTPIVTPAIARRKAA